MPEKLKLDYFCTIIYSSSFPIFGSFDFASSAFKNFSPSTIFMFRTRVVFPKSGK